MAVALARPPLSHSPLRWKPVAPTLPALGVPSGLAPVAEKRMLTEPPTGMELSAPSVLMRKKRGTSSKFGTDGETSARMSAIETPSSATVSVSSFRVSS